MRNIKVISLSLVIFIILMAFSACKDQPENQDAATQSNDISAQSNETAEETDYLDTVAKKYNFNGYEFKVMVPAAENHMPDSGAALYASEELSGELVNDALYNRNLLTNEKLNITINVFEHNPGGLGDTYAVTSASIMANDNLFDVVIPHTISGPDSLATGGFLANWNDTTGVDFSAEWWNKDAIDSFSIAGHSFFAVSEFNFGNMGNTYAMFFNKDFVNDYNLDNPYELVENHQWTLDKLLEMTSSIYRDLNGNSKVDAEDVFGYSGTTTGVLLGFMYASNIRYFDTDKDGVPYISFSSSENVEKTSDLIDKMIQLHYTNDRAYIYGNNEIDIFKAMQEERLFLQGDKIGEIIKLREYDVEFGIIPYPLYNEYQENYITYVDAWGGVMCLPSNASYEALDRTAVIIDALSYETLKSVKPKYYEVALKTKYARDEESSAMLDIIYDNLLFDLGYVFTNGNSYTWMFNNNVVSKKNQFASYMARSEKGIAKYLEKTYSSIIDNY